MMRCNGAGSGPRPPRSSRPWTASQAWPGESAKVMAVRASAATIGIWVVHRAGAPSRPATGAGLLPLFVGPELTEQHTGNLPSLPISIQRVGLHYTDFAAKAG